MNLSVVVSVLLATASTVTYSQEAPKQTVEGAHTFLQTIAKQNAFSFKHFDGVSYSNNARWSAIHGDDGRPLSGRQSLNPISIENWTGAKCVTSVGGQVWTYDYRDKVRTWISGPKIDRHRTERINVDIDYPSVNLDINWSKVPGVQRAKDSTEVRLVNLAEFRLPTVELATRVQNAMEFLRNACDPTASTGF